jgi:hypothetical protein
MQKFNETKGCFFEKINKIDKPLIKLTKRNREKTQTNKTRDKKGISQQIPMKFSSS